MEYESKIDTGNNRHTQYLNNIPGKYEIKDIQNTAMLGAAHTVRKVLMSKHKTYFAIEITLHVT